MANIEWLIPSHVIWQLCKALGVYAIYKGGLHIYHKWTSPLRYLPGPPSKSLILGNLRELQTGDTLEILQKWTDEYGSTLKYKGILGKDIVYTSDLKALNHVLLNSYNYLKPQVQIYILKRVLGNGIIFAEQDAHKKQRKILNPAFGQQQLRDMTGLFFQKAAELRDIWAEQIRKQEPEGSAQVDALSWFSRLALDIIGVAGFNYNFDALVDDPSNNELGNAFAITSDLDNRINMVGLLKIIVPALSFLPGDRDKKGKDAADTLFRVAAEILDRSKAAIRQSQDKSAFESRDILSLLVRANEMDGLPESQKLTDEEVIAQIPTFLVAGHETTSVALAWTFLGLTSNKDIQKKLRDELINVPTDSPTMDDLNSLPYLDSVVRESLRLYGPVPSSMRVVAKDDIIPLSEPFTDKKGALQHQIRIKQGTPVVIPMLGINRSKSIWGDDAMEFKPERWERIPEVVHNIPGAWSNLMTFIGGPRACIGWRFSVIEMKAILFTLIRAFEVDLAVPAEDIGSKSSMVQRPILKTESDRKKSEQMPVHVRFA